MNPIRTIEFIHDSELWFADEWQRRALPGEPPGTVWQFRTHDTVPFDQYRDAREHFFAAVLPAEDSAA